LVGALAFLEAPDTRGFFATAFLGDEMGATGTWVVLTLSTAIAKFFRSKYSGM